MHWRRKWQPTPVFLPGESQRWGSLVGCHLWGRTESDTTEATWQQQQVGHSFSSKEQESFNFMAAVTICSDFGAPQNKVFCCLAYRVIITIFLNSIYVRCCCYVTSVMSDSVRPHRWQPTRLPRPWDSPGKNTGVGCHFLLQCMKVKSESKVAQSCPTLSDPMD